MKTRTRVIAVIFIVLLGLQLRPFLRGPEDTVTTFALIALAGWIGLLIKPVRPFAWLTLVIAYGVRSLHVIGIGLQPPVQLDFFALMLITHGLPLLVVLTDRPRQWDISGNPPGIQAVHKE